MKYLNTKCYRCIVFCLIFCLLFVTITGCGVEVRKVKIDPTVLPVTAQADKVPMSAALIIDPQLKDYGIMAPLYGGTAKYEIGKYLARYTEDVSRNLFNQVTMYDSLETATNKADVILIPKAVRSSTFITTPIKVFVCMEWSVKDRTGRQMLWLTSIESEASEKPGAFSYSKQQHAVYQRVLDELCFKTLKAFRESPEISRLSPDRTIIGQ